MSTNILALSELANRRAALEAAVSQALQARERAAGERDAGIRAAVAATAAALRRLDAEPLPAAPGPSDAAADARLARRQERLTALATNVRRALRQRHEAALAALRAVPSSAAAGSRHAWRRPMSGGRCSRISSGRWDPCGTGWRPWIAPSPAPPPRPGANLRLAKHPSPPFRPIPRRR